MLFDFYALFLKVNMVTLIFMRFSVIHSSHFFYCFFSLAHFFCCVIHNFLLFFILFFCWGFHNTLFLSHYMLLIILSINDFIQCLYSWFVTYITICFLVLTAMRSYCYSIAWYMFPPILEFLKYCIVADMLAIVLGLINQSPKLDFLTRTRLLWIFHLILFF